MATLLILLARRGSSDDNNDCRSFAADNTADPISGSLTLHKLLTYISAAAMAICCISTFTLVAGHIFNYHQPRVQKQLIRMIMLMPVFAIFCFFGVLSYRLTPYFLPITQLYEAFAIVAAFYLMLALLAPHATTWQQQHAFFSLPAHGGARAFTKTYIAVLQLLPGRIITTIAVIILSAVSCNGSKHYKRGHTVIAIINGIQAVIALIALFRFLRRWLADLRLIDSRIVGKLSCFKLIVALEFLQNIVFRILTQVNALEASRTRSWNDMNYGINATMLAVEACVIGVLVVWAYWPGVHRQHALRQSERVAEAGKAARVEGMDGRMEAAAEGMERKLSPLRAVWDAVDMLDVLAGIWRAAKLYGQRRRG